MVWLPRSLLILVQSRQKYCQQSVCFVQGTVTRLCRRHMFIIVRYHIPAQVADVFFSIFPNMIRVIPYESSSFIILGPSVLDLENPYFNLASNFINIHLSAFCIDFCKCIYKLVHMYKKTKHCNYASMRQYIPIDYWYCGQLLMMLILFVEMAAISFIPWHAGTVLSRFN